MRRQRVGFRALCLADNAGTSRRRSGAASVSRTPGDRRRPARSWRSASTASPPASQVPRGIWDKESSGRSGARSVGRLQRSVRSIFPRLPPPPARGVEAASGSTDRRLFRDGELARFGRQGCWVNTYEPNSERVESPVRQRCRTSSRRKASWVDGLHHPNTVVEGHGPGVGIAACLRHPSDTPAGPGGGAPVRRCRATEDVRGQGVRCGSPSRRAQRVSSQQHELRARQRCAGRSGPKLSR